LLLVAFCAVAAVGVASAVDEVEPNDDLGSAQTLTSGGSYRVNGSTSSGTDSADFYMWNLTNAAVVEIIVNSSWGCAGAACENLSVIAPNGSVLIDPFGDPMIGKDVYFSGLAGATWSVRVAAGSPGGAYSLSVTVYPFGYSAGQTVDVSLANQSSAIVAFADSDLKSSTHPYDLASEGDGVYYGYTLNLFVVNVGPLDLRVFLPAGLIWRSEDGRYADYVVTRDQSVVVRAWTYDQVAFVAVTLSPYPWIPGDPSRPGNDPTYYLGPHATGDLSDITDETDLRTYSYQAEQIAVWAYQAGQSSNDLDNLGASLSAKNEAINILDRADVDTALNARTTTFWSFPILSGIWDAFPFWLICFFGLFMGIPLIVGLSQALRVVRLKNLRIDGAYGGPAGYDRQWQAREDIRARRREAKALERQRREDRKRQEEAARAAQLPPVPAQPLPVPVVVAPTPPAITPLTVFLENDPDERFDLDALNGLDFNGVLAEAMKAKATAAQTATKAQALLKRIHTDVADPDTIDDIVRDRMVKWYRQSPASAEWTTIASFWWAGLVAESRAAGGRRRTALETRLEALRSTCATRGNWFKPKLASEKKDQRRKGQAEPPPDPVAVKAQVVQAVLDDMAAGPRGKDAATHPLPVLSELAAKLSTQRVNQALAEMFKADVRGPYVVMHPSRYPDCDITAIRPPAQGARAGAMAYEIVFVRSAPQGAMPTAGVATSAVVVPGTLTPNMLDLSGAIWDRSSVTNAEWVAILGEVQRQRQRLDPPPGAYRKSPPYFTLRQLLVSDAEARRTFLAVKWRGKPVGVSLLAQLLVDGSLTPEFDTDREYFEAELGDLERGDPQYQSPNGRWTIAPGVVVVRGGDPNAGITYKVAPS
jgi:hypothetical protein